MKLLCPSAVIGLCLCLTASVFSNANALVTEGSVISDDYGPWLIGSFCYDFTKKTDGNALEVLADTYIDRLGNQSIYLYNQTKQSWGVANSATTCKGAVEAAYYGMNFEGMDEYILSPQVVSWGNQAGINKNAGYLQVFAAASTQDCNKSGDVAITWRIEFKQPGGGFFREQFSCEDFGILEIYLIASLVYVVIGIAHFFQMQSLRRMDSLHTVMRLFASAVCFELAAVICNTFHLLAVADNGVGILIFKWFSEGSDVIGQLCFILVLLALARGWTVTDAVLQGRAYLACAFGMVTVLYLCFFIWQSSYLYMYNISNTLALFDSYPGVLLVLLRCLVCFVFMYFCWTSYRETNHTVKRKFILQFGITFTLWMVLFLVCLGFSQTLPFYTLKKVNSLIYLAFTAVGLVMFLLLTWPSRVRHYLDISSRDTTAPEPTMAAMPRATAGNENTQVMSSNTPYDKL